MHQILEKDVTASRKERVRRIGLIGRMGQLLVCLTSLTESDRSDGVRIPGGGAKLNGLERWEDFMKRQSLFLCTFAD